MEPSNAAHDFAPELEEGRLATYNDSIEKPEILNPSTISGSTLVASGTLSPSKSGSQTPL